MNDDKETKDMAELIKHMDRKVLESTVVELFDDCRRLRRELDDATGVIR